MKKKKIIFSSNPPWLFSGLAENGKFLMKHLQKTGKYDLVYYTSQSSINDPMHKKMPWKSIGCIPPDNILQQYAQDQNKIRSIAYGSYYIDQVVRDEKPDILLCSDDAWSFQGEFIKADWWNKIHSILHITLDSLPILPLGYEQALSTPNFYTWAKFAKKEMNKRPDCKHVNQIYGITDVNNFAPISKEEKLDLRKKFGIGEKTIILGYTFRNQLRKEAMNILKAFSEFKKENKDADVKIHLHTSWSENQQGWNFPHMMNYLGINQADILATYVCKSCKNWLVNPYVGEDINCPYCGSQKSMITANLVHGVPGEEMKYVYGIRDATISPLTSGGQEFELVNTLLCGLPLACTSYSSGEDFTELPFVTPIKWHFRAEAQSSFIKATNDINSIKNFINKVYRMNQKEKDEIGEKGRDYAVKTFSPDVIGKKWEDIFDALLPKDWSSITLERKPKNPNYKLPENVDEMSDVDYVKLLYKNILDMNVYDSDEGLKNWLSELNLGR